MNLALNIADLTRYDAIPRQLIIAPVIQSQHIVNTDTTRFDESAVVLECEESRGRAIIEILRGYDAKAKRYALRAYQQGPRGGWSKLTDPCQS